MTPNKHGTSAGPSHREGACSPEPTRIPLGSLAVVVRKDKLPLRPVVISTVPVPRSELKLVAIYILNDEHVNNMR